MNKYASIFAVLLLVLSGSAEAQQVKVTFRYVPTSPVYSVSLPGTFNGWTASSSTAMTYVDSLGQWISSRNFQVGERAEYKFFVTGAAGQAGSWLTDPNNPDTNPNDNLNSVLTVGDPMIFEPAEQTNAAGLVTRFSAGVFSSGALSSLTYKVGNQAEMDGMSHYNPETGIFSVDLSSPVVSGTLFTIAATSPAGTVNDSIGQLSQPVFWTTIERKTTREQTRLRAAVSRHDGTVDPSITEASLMRNGQLLMSVPVTNGQIDQVVPLEPGNNVFTVRAQVGGVTEQSEELSILRRPSPLESAYFDLSVSGAANSFMISLSETGISPGAATVSWVLDSKLSTAPVTSFSGSGPVATGTVSGPGEVFVDISFEGANGTTQKARAAVVVEADGSARTLANEETASWINQAVVYEIFPLSFGPTATGTFSEPGNRFNEIRASLEYIRSMGFNTIWFMPIMLNLAMTDLSGGYNILDFYQVDPNLGSNEDFKALVDAAHDLGVRIVLDLTINHVSPAHEWVASLRTDGDYPGYIQTSPNPHTSGLDSRGASLPEQWQENTLYRAYDGFAGLANLNYLEPDLQADMMEVVQFWLNEFGVDGYRMDAYWGPWRRYGPAVFGVPLRQVIRRARPDAWILAEIEGVGNGTEVYYADDDNGSVKIQGGIDSGYDWSFSGHLNSTSKYGRVNEYPSLMTNYGFWPGPNARYFRFLENHDWTRIQKLFATAPDRIKPLTGLLMSAPGIPMIYQGQEVGYGSGSGDTRRLPVSWSTPQNKAWARMHRFLATARTTFPAFWTQEIEFLNSTGNVLAFVRPQTNENAVVLINFAASPSTIAINPSTKVRVDYDGPIPYTDLAADTTAYYLGSFSVTVPAYSTVIYVTDAGASLGLGALPDLPFNAVYTGKEDEKTLPVGFALDQNYPNPFNPSTSISFSIPSATHVSLKVFDVLGREVASLVEGVRHAGIHTVEFDASGLASGAYLYRLTTPSGTASRTLVILK